MTRQGLSRLRWARVLVALRLSRLCLIALGDLLLQPVSYTELLQVSIAVRLRATCFTTHGEQGRSCRLPTLESLAPFELLQPL